MAVIELFVDDIIVFQQTIVSNPFGLYVNDTLVITETIHHSLPSAGTSQKLIFGQTVEVRKSINNISVTQSMPLYQQGAKGPGPQGILQTFYAWHEARVVEYEQIVHTLNIQQTIDVDYVKAAYNTLVMTQTVGYTMVRNIEVIDTLNLEQGASNFKSDEDTYSITIPSIGGPNEPIC